MFALGNSFDLYYDVLEVFLNADSLARQQLLVDDLDDEVVAAVIHFPTLGPEDLVVNAFGANNGVVKGVDEHCRRLDIRYSMYARRLIIKFINIFKSI